MIRFTLTTSLTLAVLLCGSSSRLQAGDTPITVKDGGSILLSAGGLDAGKTWKVSPNELRHLDAKGVLTSLKITEGGADRCGGRPEVRHRCDQAMEDPGGLPRTMGHYRIRLRK